MCASAEDVVAGEGLVGVALIAVTYLNTPRNRLALLFYENDGGLVLRALVATIVSALKLSPELDGCVSRPRDYWHPVFRVAVSCRQTEQPLPDAVGPLNRSFLVVVIPLLACTRRELPLLPLPPKISLTLTPFEAAADP